MNHYQYLQAARTVYFIRKLFFIAVTGFIAVWLISTVMAMPTTCQQSFSHHFLDFDFSFDLPQVLIP